MSLIKETGWKTRLGVGFYFVGEMLASIVVTLVSCLFTLVIYPIDGIVSIPFYLEWIFVPLIIAASITLIWVRHHHSPKAIMERTLAGISRGMLADFPSPSVGASFKGRERRAQFKEGLLWLNLRGINLDSIPDLAITGNLEAVQVIDLSKNRLTTTMGLARFKNLQAAFLGENCIDDVAGLLQLPELRVLDLSKNRVSTKHHFENLPVLQFLGLKKNPLENLVGLRNMPNLRGLWVDDACLPLSNGLTTGAELCNLIEMRDKRGGEILMRWAKISIVILIGFTLFGLPPLSLSLFSWLYCLGIIDYKFLCQNIRIATLIGDQDFIHRKSKELKTYKKTLVPLLILLIFVYTLLGFIWEIQTG